VEFKQHILNGGEMARAFGAVVIVKRNGQLGAGFPITKETLIGRCAYFTLFI
jgi:hypothetical protein